MFKPLQNISVEVAAIYANLESFKEGEWIITVSASGFIFVFDKVENERETDRVKEDFEWVVVRNKIFNGEVKEGKLLMSFHDFLHSVGTQRIQESGSIGKEGGTTR